MKYISLAKIIIKKAKQQQKTKRHLDSIRMTKGSTRMLIDQILLVKYINNLSINQTSLIIQKYWPQDTLCMN